MITESSSDIRSAIPLETINKWGSQLDCDTADAALGQVIWPIKASVQLYLFIDSPIQLYVRSTDPDDTILGDGARTVKGMYHDSNGISQTFELDMDGNNNVALPGTGYGVFRFSVETTGDSNENEGQVQIIDGSNNIYAVIEPGAGQTQIAVFRIPNNRTGLVKAHRTDYARSAATINDAQMKFRVRKADGTLVLKADPLIGSNKPEDIIKYEKGGIFVDSGEWIYWECDSVSANNTPIRGLFDIELYAL